MFYIEEFKHSNPLKSHISVFNKTMSCKVYPELGASLQSLIIKNIEVILGIDSLPEPSYIFTAYPSALLFPFPGRIENGNYSYGNKQYQLEQNEQYRDHAIHGLVAHQPFTLIHSKTTVDSANLSFLYSTKNADNGFPFDFNFTVHYTFTNDEVHLNLEIQNTGNTTFPFALGWHPYFKSDELSQNILSFQTSKEVLCNEEMIPTKKKEIRSFKDLKIRDVHFDTCYVLDRNLIKFRTKQYAAQIKINSENQHYLQLFTPSSRDCIAIEPMTCLPNVFNNKEGLSELNPNEHFNWTIELQIKTQAHA
jgi:aldose 1-epimerase